MTWNFDFTNVPLGKDVTVPRLVADKNSASGKTVRDVTEYQRDDLILASKCGKVIKSYWIPAEERFAGFSKGEQPIAWTAWPEHPNHQSDAGAIAAVKGTARLANAPSVEPSASGLFILDDCGSGQ